MFLCWGCGVLFHSSSFCYSEQLCLSALASSLIYKSLHDYILVCVFLVIELLNMTYAILLSVFPYLNLVWLKYLIILQILSCNFLWASRHFFVPRHVCGYKCSIYIFLCYLARKSIVPWNLRMVKECWICYHFKLTRLGFYVVWSLRQKQCRFVLKFIIKLLYIRLVPQQIKPFSRW